MTENQFKEMFRLVSLTANKVQEIEKKIDGLEEGQEALRREFQEGQSALRQEFIEFRDETRDNFGQLGVEQHKQARVIKIMAKDLTETRAQVDELNERVERLEHKDAA